MAEQRAASPQGDAAMPAYERQRLERIKRNQQVLRDLGLDTLPAELAAASRKRARKQQHAGDAASRKQQREPLEPSRRSRRLQQQEAEVPPQGGRLQHQAAAHSPRQRQRLRRELLDDGGGGPCDGWSGSQLNVAGLQSLLQRDPGNPHHQHNIHRLRSMSSKALMTRVWRITNRAKLQSLVQVLQAGEGPEQLLAAADEALSSL